jgi:hypothetical protein
MSEQHPAGLDGLADWSPWVDFAVALDTAPRTPGVYLARADGHIVYVGMAGPRDRGGSTVPKGVRGRLAFYAGGKALASGLGEAVFARAIADPHWLRARLTEVEAGRPGSLRDWGRAAFTRAGLQVCWASTADRSSALALERQVLDALATAGLWNQRR